MLDKQELLEKFVDNSTFSSKQVKHIISTTKEINIEKDFSTKPSFIKKGDVIISYEGKKSRPSVVIKVTKEREVVYIPLTSTENIHCLSKSESRFFGEGCFTKSLSVCTEDFAIEHFVGVYDNNKLLNEAILAIGLFYSNIL